MYVAGQTLSLRQRSLSLSATSVCGRGAQFVGLHHRRQVQCKRCDTGRGRRMLPDLASEDVQHHIGKALIIAVSLEPGWAWTRSQTGKATDGAPERAVVVLDVDL